MIRHYLSSNNEMCYSAKTQTFSSTKHTLRPPPTASLEIAGIVFYSLYSVKIFRLSLHPALALSYVCVSALSDFLLFLYSLSSC